MQFFVVSDIHSFYKPLIKALNEAGFDAQNSDHWLIVCGDCFDRGPDSEAVLHFLMSLERKVLIKGNHDLLLEDCCLREFPYSHDVSNGTVKTIENLGGASYKFDECCQTTWNKLAAYRDLLVTYFETENYIFVHSWVPLRCFDDLPMYFTRDRCFTYNPNWRNASTSEWEQAMWGNPFMLAEQGLNKTGKTIVFGHWHCSTGWAKDEGRSEFDTDAKWDIYRNETQNIIAIDRCTAYTEQVNVLVLEDNFISK